MLSHGAGDSLETTTRTNQLVADQEPDLEHASQDADNVRKRASLLRKRELARQDHVMVLHMRRSFSETCDDEGYTHQQLRSVLWNMAANWEQISVFVTSFGKDFVKERGTLLKEVVVDLESWCETRKIQVEVTDVRWGCHVKKSELERIQKMISDCYFQNQMPFFINLTSERLGRVPLWGDAPESVINDFQQKFKLSLSELEVLFGAYREDNPNSIFVVRDDSFVEDLIAESELGCFEHLETIPVRCRGYISASLAKYPVDRVVKYRYDSVQYDDGEEMIKTELSSTFGSQLLELLKCKIMKDKPVVEVEQDDIYAQMKQAQESFMAAHSKKIRGREDILEQINDYIETEGRNVPLLLLGGAGSGKTSILTKAVPILLEKAKEKLLPCPSSDGWHIFYHFVGAVPHSTDVESVLKRLVKELDIVHPSSLPKDLSAASQLCCHALRNPNTKPAVVVLDAINQLDERGVGMNLMSWLPKELAPNVRCILSMINDTEHHQSLLNRHVKPRELHMTPLDFESRKEIAMEMLEGHHKLSRNLMNQLLSKRMSENPLWLSVACEELKLVPKHKKLGEYIEALPDGLLDLLENVLERFEHENGDLLVVATLCLLEASRGGLLESELLDILGDEADLVPPSPFEEKDEKECSEKECSEKKVKVKESLSDDKWRNVFRALKPFLRPYGDNKEGRLDFYHRALSKAVRRKYFKKDEDSNTDNEESKELYSFWHKKLADYFSECEHVERKIEEYLFHLCKTEDHGRLIRCLCDWQVVDKLYNEEYSSQLLSYWRMVGGANEMIEHYKVMLQELEETEPRSEELIALRYEHIARIFLQSGKYGESLELTTVALKVEERELGSRPERLVELYGLLAEIYDEKLKLNDFVSPSQLPDLRKTINYGRKSIELRKTFTGNYHQYKLGLSIMKLAFSLESWEACGGDSQMSGEEALAEGNEQIDSALEIFKTLKDDGHYAEALMTKGVLAPRGSSEQLGLYNQAMEICLQVYGEQALLTSRLYINIGIVHEDNKNFVKAYEFFKKWASVSQAVLGPDHPKTKRALGVLKEPRYKLVALRLKQQEDNPVAGGADNDNSTEPMDDATINQEVESLDDFDGTDPYENAGDSEEEASDEVDNIEGDFIAVTEELQQAITELLQRAIGQAGDLDLSHLNIHLSGNRNPANNEPASGDNRLSEAAGAENRNNDNRCNDSDNRSISDNRMNTDSDNRDSENQSPDDIT